MIYKIMSEFNGDLSNFLSKLEKEFDIVFFKDILYVASRDYRNGHKIIEQQKKKIKDIIKKDCVILEINENNLKNEPNQIIEWCKEKFVAQDTKRLEVEKQKELQAFLKFIEDFQKNLEEQIQNE